MRRRWRKCQRKNNNNAKENGTRKIPFLTRCDGAGGKASARIRRTERVKFRSSRARHSTSRARVRGVRENGKYVCSHANTHTNLHSHTGILGNPRREHDDVVASTKRTGHANAITTRSASRPSTQRFAASSRAISVRRFAQGCESAA